MSGKTQGGWVAAAVVIAILVVGLLPSAVEARDTAGDRPVRHGLTALSKGAPPTRDLITRRHAGRLDVGVTIELDRPPAGPLIDALAAAGFEETGRTDRSIDGYLDPKRLRDVSGIPGVRAVRAVRRPTPAVAGQAPSYHGANPWHLEGYRGLGVKVGILDVGFGGMLERLGTELPSSVHVRCYPVMGRPSSMLSSCGSDTHGTAVAESVIDMAPDVELYVADPFAPTDISDAISWMTAEGVRVINYSRISSFVIDGMGDGTSSYTDSDYALIDQAVAGGAMFVASAGNEGQTSWMGTPADADGDFWVEFSGASEINLISLAAGETIAVAVRWPTAASDYDLMIWRGDSLLAISADAQSLTGDPFEFLSYEATTTGEYEISIWHSAGPQASLMRLMVKGGDELSHRVTAGSLPSPADSRNPGMLAVGAINPTTGVARPYSSRGPTLDGRVKPDIAAIDCVTTSVEPEFCGTSQAAPYVTGAAALLLEADPTHTPQSLASALRSRAIPLGAAVPNNDTGYGRLAVGPLPEQVPTELVFLAPAATGVAGAAFVGQPTVGILDARGRLVTRGPGAVTPVTLGISTNPGSGTLTCGTGTTVAATGGVAAFGGCAIDAVGTGYTLSATAVSLPGAVSPPFAVRAPGAPPPVTLSATPKTVTYGAVVHTTARSATGAGQWIDFQWSDDGRWYDVVSSDVTGPDGSVSITSTPVIHGRYRAATTDAVTGIVDVSIPMPVSVASRATATSSVPSGRTVRRTTRITVTTTIRPSGEGVSPGRARIDMLLRSGGKWVRRRTLYANADALGRARIVMTLPGSGTWLVRARAERTATNGASAWTAGFRYYVP